MNISSRLFSFIVLNRATTFNFQKKLERSSFEKKTMIKYFLFVLNTLFLMTNGHTQSKLPTLSFDLEMIVEEPKDSQYPSQVLLDSKNRILFLGAEFSNSRATNGYNIWESAIWRRLPDGQIDTTFGDNGTIIYSNSYKGNEIQVAAIQSDDKIIIGELVRGKSSDSLRITRFLKEGKVDATFGKAGNLMIDPQPFEGANLQLKDIKIQTDGKILALGNYTQGTEFGQELFICRILTDGKLDESFGQSGMVKTQLGKFQDRGIEMLVEDDGKIWILGHYHNKSIFAKDLQIDIALIRLNSNGNFDKEFAMNGVVKFTGEQRFYSPYKIKNLSNGKIVIAGFSNPKPGQGNHFILILDQKKAMNLEVEKNQFAFFESPDQQNFQLAEMFLLEDESFLMCGTNQVNRETELLFTHFTPEGKPNLNFNKKGFLIKKMEGQMKLNPISGIQQQDGKIIIAGSTRKKIGYPDLFFLRLEVK